MLASVDAADRTAREPSGTLLTSLSRHDLVLLAIPAAFALALLASSLLGLPVERTLAGAAIVGVATLIDALFVNPPLDGGAST